MPKMTGARFIAETLHGYGLSTIFWMPAIIKPGIMEMERVGMRRVLCHSEKAAAYMADGYARASRRPAVAMSQSVGAANLAAGLQDAFLAGSPVIAITGAQRANERHRHAYQEIHSFPLFEPITKYNSRVDTVEQLPFELRQAFRSATTGAPGPVHIELPGLQGEFAADAEADLQVVVEEAFTRCPAFRPEPEPARVREAVRLLVEAKRPVILAGGGAVISDAGPEIAQLAAALGIPVATSLNAKRVIPGNHPLLVGVAGTYSRTCANRTLAEADLVLIVGSHTGDQVTDMWTLPRAGATVIQIDIDPAELGRTFPATVPLVGDAKATLKQIIDALGKVSPRSDWPAQVRKWVNEWRAEYEPLLTSDAIPMRPERICRELQEALPPDALLISDTGHAGGWTGTMIDLNHPEQRYLRCAGSLGWAFPAALGAKCALPDRPVVCFTGDGGFWYHLAEMETAVRCGINTVTVINNNRSLNQDRPGVDRAYVRYRFPEGNSRAAWVYEDVDFAGLAQRLGCFAIRVTHADKIQDAIAQALESEKPAIVDVVSDMEAYAPWTRRPVVPS
ncbi:MAG TPA: thiamine pyrophosphate-binding protein [Planctomycetaceae bacterium]|nr:thiamine pyrophosphate-binding protein [Planctomycetaceae bacterium]